MGIIFDKEIIIRKKVNIEYKNGYYKAFYEDYKTLCYATEERQSTNIKLEELKTSDKGLIVYVQYDSQYKCKVIKLNDNSKSSILIEAGDRFIFDDQEYEIIDCFINKFHKTPHFFIKSYTAFEDIQENNIKKDLNTVIYQFFKSIGVISVRHKKIFYDKDIPSNVPFALFKIIEEKELYRYETHQKTKIDNLYTAEITIYNFQLLSEFAINILNTQSIDEFSYNNIKYAYFSSFNQKIRQERVINKKTTQIVNATIKIDCIYEFNNKFSELQSIEISRI